MKKLPFLLSAAILLLFTQCNTVRYLPASTSGSVFSLKGQWQLASGSDTKNRGGTVVTFLPGFSEAMVQTLPPVYSSWVQERNATWCHIKIDPNGGFLAESACTGSPQYKTNSISVVDNDEIRVRTLASTTADGELVQTWRRKGGS